MRPQQDLGQENVLSWAPVPKVDLWPCSLPARPRVAQHMAARLFGYQLEFTLGECLVSQGGGTARLPLSTAGCWAQWGCIANLQQPAPPLSEDTRVQPAPPIRCKDTSCQHAASLLALFLSRPQARAHLCPQPQPRSPSLSQQGTGETEDRRA